MSTDDRFNAKYTKEASRNDELDRLLVEGELVADENGSQRRVYLKSCEIAQRLNVSPSWVSKYARLNRCFQRRAELNALVETRARDELVRSEGRRLAFDTERAIRLVDETLEAYEQSIREHGVGRVTSADINTLIRLRRYLEGDADTRQEVMGSLSLESIQAAHRELLEDMQRFTPEERGVVDDVPRWGATKALEAPSEDAVGDG